MPEHQNNEIASDAMHITAVLYVRVSSAGQVNKGFDPEGYSIPAQREACRRHAEALRAEVLREYVEPGRTGTTTKRPALQQMLSDLVELKPTYTPMTAKRPPAPLARSAVHRMLRDDYYIGIVTYNGQKADGQHPPPIDIETFERVQKLLQGHGRSGDCAQKHEHYLKGSIYYGQCGGRLIFTRVRGMGANTRTSAASAGTTCATAARRRTSGWKPSKQLSKTCTANSPG